jgi:hypothetical protein
MRKNKESATVKGGAPRKLGVGLGGRGQEREGERLSGGAGTDLAGSIERANSPQGGWKKFFISSIFLLTWNLTGVIMFSHRM